MTTKNPKRTREEVREAVKKARLKHGEPCPICKTTLEWSSRECDNCGYDKP